METTESKVSAKNGSGSSHPHSSAIGGSTLTQRLSTVIDLCSKGIAAIAIGVYGCGFLVISLHDSSYGFVEINPFRPRILAAGVWFLLFFGVPVITVALAVKHGLKQSTMARTIVVYIGACSSLSVPASALMELQAKGPDLNGWLLSIWLTLLGMSLMLARLKVLRRHVPSWVPESSLGLFVVLYLGGLTWLVVSIHDFGPDALILWFLGVSGVAAFIALGQLQSGVRQFSDPLWAVAPFGLLLGSLAIFSLYYYPRLKASIGGGAPTSIVLYFSSHSPIKPNEHAPVRLIDESDAGYYVAASGDKHAIFIPRESVSFVYFGDKPADSSFLHQPISSEDSKEPKSPSPHEEAVKPK